MKLSTNNLNKYIDLYLSDSYDYDGDETGSTGWNVLKNKKLH